MFMTAPLNVVGRPLARHSQHCRREFAAPCWRRCGATSPTMAGLFEAEAEYRIANARRWRGELKRRAGSVGVRVPRIGSIWLKAAGATGRPTAVQGGLRT